MSVKIHKFQIKMIKEMQAKGYLTKFKYPLLCERLKYLENEVYHQKPLKKARNGNLLYTFFKKAGSNELERSYAMTGRVFHDDFYPNIIQMKYAV